MRVLKKEGKAYKREVQNFLGRNHPEFLSFFSRKDEEFEVVIIALFAIGDVYCKTWGKDPKVRRHKKTDASNRVKLLEDTIVEAAGYDDAQHISISVTKGEVMPGQDPYVEVWAWGEFENGPIAQFVATRSTSAL
jgi:Holliday junction resolvase RusA-like endonuclease